MAKQTGFLKITGTLGDVTFYELDGEFYARKKSSLDGKRVKKDPRFRRTMEEAGEFGKASKAARDVYRELPAEQKGHGIFGRLTGRMRKLMREGIDTEEAKLQLLKELCAVEVTKAQQDASTNSKPDDFAEKLLKQVFDFSGELQPRVQVLRRNQRRLLSSEHEEIRFSSQRGLAQSTRLRRRAVQQFDCKSGHIAEKDYLSSQRSLHF